MLLTQGMRKHPAPKGTKRGGVSREPGELAGKTAAAKQLGQLTSDKAPRTALPAWIPGTPAWK